MLLKCRKFWIFAILSFFTIHSAARESIQPIAKPSNSFTLGGTAELLDDVYSADLNTAIEIAPCNCLSIYGNASYRFASYKYDVMLHDQRHEAINLKINGFNEPYLGTKIVPSPFWGIDLAWRFLPGNGSQQNKFQRLSIAPMALYEFSPNLELGLSIGYHTFLKRKNFNPGNEIGLKGSLIWHILWNSNRHSGIELSHVFLYRWRISESENLNMAKQYQKMDDKYRGFRMRTDVVRYFNLKRTSPGLGFFYEMNRGNIFGFETGHTIGIYTKFVFP